MPRRATLAALFAPAALVAGAGASACAPRDTLGPVGVSPPTPAPAEALPTSGQAPPMPATVPHDFRARFAKMNRARFASQGHLVDRFWVDVYANDAGRAAYDGKVASAAVGAMLVKDSFEHRLEGEVQGPVFVMEKREKGFDPESGDWRYVVVNAEGKVASDGKLRPCALCHNDAPHDHLFRAAP